MMDEFRVSTLDIDGAVRVVIAGEIDVLTGSDTEDAIVHALERAPRYVELDMDEVTFFGSGGIGALCRSQLVAERAGVPIRVTRASYQVRRVLEVTGLDVQFLASGLS
jgi:anti-sigma B factor antagonist